MVGKVWDSYVASLIQNSRRRHARQAELAARDQGEIQVVRAASEQHSLAAMSLNEVLPNARNLSAADKLRLIRILAEDVETAPDVVLFDRNQVYESWTPTAEPGTVEALMRVIEADARK